MLLHLVVSVVLGMQVMLIYILRLYPLYARGQFDLPRGRGVRVRGLGAHDAGALLRRHLVPARRVAGAAGAHRDDGHAGRGGHAQRLRLQRLDDRPRRRSDLLRLRRHDHRHRPCSAGTSRWSAAPGRARTSGSCSPCSRSARRDARRGRGSTCRRRTCAQGDLVLVPARRASRGGRTRSSRAPAAVDEALLTGESTPVEKAVGARVLAGSLVIDDALVVSGDASRRSRRASPRSPRSSRRRSRPRLRCSASRTGLRRSSRRSSSLAAAACFVGLVDRDGLSRRPPCCRRSPSSSWRVPARSVWRRRSRSPSLSGGPRAPGIVVRNAAALETAGDDHARRLRQDGHGDGGRHVGRGRRAGSRRRRGRARPALPRQRRRGALRRTRWRGRSPPRARDPDVDVDQHQSLRGHGVSARLERRRAGPRRLGRLRRRGRGRRTAAEADAALAEGDTVVWVAGGTRVLGFIVVRDQPDPTAAEAVSELAARGIETSLLSGDDAATTAAVARRTGIAASEGDVSPEAKAAFIVTRGRRPATASPWSATGSTMGRRSRRRTSASRRRAGRMSRPRPPTSSCCATTSRWCRGSSTCRGRVRRIVRQNLWWAFAYNAGRGAGRRRRTADPGLRRGDDVRQQPARRVQLAPPAALTGPLVPWEDVECRQRRSVDGDRPGGLGHGDAACALVPAGATVAAHPLLAATVPAPLAAPGPHRGAGGVGRARAGGHGVRLARRHAARDRTLRRAGAAARVRRPRHLPAADGRAELGDRGVLGGRRRAARLRRRRPLHRSLGAARPARRRAAALRRPRARRVHRRLLRAPGADRLRGRPRPGHRRRAALQAAGGGGWRHRLLRQARGAGAPARTTPACRRWPWASWRWR